MRALPIIWKRTSTEEDSAARTMNGAELLAVAAWQTPAAQTGACQTHESDEGVHTQKKRMVNRSVFSVVSPVL